MQLDYAFLAKIAEFSDDLTLTLIEGDLTSLEGTFPFRPLPFALAAKITLEPGDEEREVTFSIEVLDQGMQRIHIEDVQVVSPSKEMSGTMKGGVVFDLSAVTFKGPGVYLFRLLWDGTEIKTLPLQVHQRASIEPQRTSVTVSQVQ